MSKKKDRQNIQKKYYDTKSLLIKLVKRYGLIMIIATIISVIFCYIMSEEVAGFTPIVAVFSTLAIILACILFGTIIFNKLDAKEEENYNSEKERDPFVD